MVVPSEGPHNSISLGVPKGHNPALISTYTGMVMGFPLVSISDKRYLEVVLMTTTERIV